jgi:hypothetical protein
MEARSDAIGADEDITAALLLEIGARKSRKAESESWGLISRNPFPADLSN